MPRKLKVIPNEHFDTICGLHETQGLGARRIDKTMGGMYGHPFVSLILKECSDPIARQRRTGVLVDPQNETLKQILSRPSLATSVNMHQTPRRSHESEESGNYAPQSWMHQTMFEPLMMLEDSPGLQIGDAGLTHVVSGADPVIDNDTTNPWTSQAEWEFAPFTAFLKSPEFDPSLYLRAILESKKRKLKRSYVDRVLHGTGTQTTDWGSTDIRATSTQRDPQVDDLIRRANALLNSNKQEPTPSITHVEDSPKATTQPAEEATVEDTDVETRSQSEPKHVEDQQLPPGLGTQPTVEGYRKSENHVEHDLADITRNDQRLADDNSQAPNVSVQETPNNVHEVDTAGGVGKVLQPGSIESQPTAAFTFAKADDTSSLAQPSEPSKEDHPITDPSVMIATIKTDIPPMQPVEVVSTTPIPPLPAKAEHPPSNSIHSSSTEVLTAPSTDHVQGNRSDVTPSQSVCPIGCSILESSEPNQEGAFDTVYKIILLGAGLYVVTVIAAPHLRSWYAKWKSSNIQNYYHILQPSNRAATFIPATQTFRPIPQLYGKVTGVAFY